MNDVIDLQMTREELQLLARILNTRVRAEFFDNSSQSELSNFDFTRRLINAKAGNTVNFDENLLRRLGMWKEDPTQGDGE